jgi:hypothetical protein
MKPIPIDNLPEFMRRQIKFAGKATPAVKTQKTHKARGPNKTEEEYPRAYIGDTYCMYEAITFRFANGHRYTPDWIYWDEQGIMHAVEVKGAYRLGSYQRARLAFDQARVEFPAVRFVWAERKKSGGWVIQ